MYPWRRILVPTDFSTASAWVFEDAVRIAGATGAEIVILHVRMTRTSQPEALRFPADGSLYDYAERIELERIHDVVKRANAAISARLLVRLAPDPGAEICRTASEEDVDLIVMSTHARHHVAHLFVGSTTRAVMVDAEIPLLAIRYGTRLANGLRRLVVPIHLQQKSLAALELATSVASWESGTVDLVAVSNAEQRDAAAAFLDRIAAERLGSVSSTRSVVAGANVEREVLRHLEKAQADALFINMVEEPTPVEIDLIRKAPIPVMLVPVRQAAATA